MSETVDKARQDAGTSFNNLLEQIQRHVPIGTEDYQIIYRMVESLCSNYNRLGRQSVNAELRKQLGLD